MSLDITKPQKVVYAVPTWLRDRQILANCKREGVGRIQPGPKRAEPIAVVCFGPSLRETWEQVKGYRYVMTCSGAHKFLVERGVIPTWHVEVDPRAHKVGLIGIPCPETEYLIASTCHPAVFDHLSGMKVKLWHVFDSTEDGKRILPAGEQLVTGGCDVGLRSIALAALLGFTQIDVFGMDGSAGTVDAPLDSRHAAHHPNSGKPKQYSEVEYGGVHYLSTPGMLEAVRQLHHELDQLPAVTVRLFGEGLAQHMMRNYQRKPATSAATENAVAYVKPELISPEYRRQNEQLHQENPFYGAGGAKHKDTVLKLVGILQKESPVPVTVLDYGAGKRTLARELPFPIAEYDPAIPEIAESPRPADLVICTDTLEHIEPELLPFVLDDLRRCLRRLGFFTIHTGPAAKTLPNGWNTHRIQQKAPWWEQRLSEFFHVAKMWEVGPEVLVLVAPKPR